MSLAELNVHRMISELGPEAVAEIMSSLTKEELVELDSIWRFWAREDQLLTEGEWLDWLILAGRGWGKTRTGAETTIEIAKSSVSRIALMGRTAADIRDVMIEGESGIMACSPPDFRPIYQPSKRLLTWPNGSIATTYSAEKPDLLRGPQHHFGWADEICTWPYVEKTWSNYQFGLRLGDNPRSIITTTPRPTKFLKSLVASVKTKVTTGTTYDNAANLADNFVKQIIEKYEGTRLGRQELNAEILGDVPGALWTWDRVDASRVARPPISSMDRIVVAVDPPASSTGAECGIVVAGLEGNKDEGDGYLLNDLSVGGLSPSGWAQKAVNGYRAYQADAIVAEVNNGGNMIADIIGKIDRNIPVIEVRATRGKIVRAEPIATLHERGRIKHAHPCPELEEQLTTYTGERDQDSPDRLDAYVWAFTELFGGESERQFAPI